MTLPNDIARCPGFGSDAEGWRDGCEDCQRRTAGGGDYVAWMIPPPLVIFWCELHIRPETKINAGDKPGKETL